MIFKAAFYIKSPLQYLNAVEAKAYYGLDNDECLLIFSADRKNYEQLSNLIDLSDWGSIVNLYSSSVHPKLDSKTSLDYRHPLFKNDIFSIAKLSFLANKCDSVGKVFIGDARNSLMQHFANKVNCDNVVLLDDGIASRIYAQWRLEGWQGGEFRFKKKIRLFIKKILFGLRDGLRESLIFFSAYDVKLPSHDRLIKNTFNVLREKFSEAEHCNSVFFLGGALVEAGILTEDEYFSQLKLVKRYFKNTSVVYVAHRRENPERVIAIGERYGWSTVLYDYPIEYQLAVIGPRPQKIASFISSALENCQAIFGSSLPILSFRFAPEFFSMKESERGAEIWRFFDYYESISNAEFKVVSL